MEKYYKVLWRKKTQKKNKTWDGDGILTNVNNFFILYDMDGKELRKVRGTTDLKPGQTFDMGVKELEVENEIEKSVFVSGKCFIQPTLQAPTIMPKIPKLGKSKPVVMKQNQPKPRHDPNNPEALVLNRPTPEHIKRFNPKNLPIVDVVVDPVIGKHLRPHQKEGVQFLYNCLMGYKDYQGTGAILADEMSLGKTLQTITLIWTFLKQTPYFGQHAIAQRVLIVCPATLILNWKNEFKKWLGDERIKVFVAGVNTKDSVKEIKDFELSKRIFPVLIVGYERLRILEKSIKSIPFDLIVCDEGHRLKSNQIKLTQVLNSFSCKRRIILSGTPVQNDLSEYFAMIDFVNPGILGSYSTFKRIFEDPIMQSRKKEVNQEMKELGISRNQELMDLTNQFVLRRTADINKKFLPPKTEWICFCPLTSVQKQLYQHILQNSSLTQISRDESSKISMATHLIALNALRKLVNSPEILYQSALLKSVDDVIDENTDPSGVFNDLLLNFEKLSKEVDSFRIDLKKEFAEFDVSCSGKLLFLDSFLKTLKDCNDKLVLISNFTQTLELLEKIIINNDLRFFRLDGSTPTSKRLEMVQRFNQPDNQHRVFLLSSKSGGTGLNLIGANRLILFEPDWNPANDQQAMARIWRDGQKKHVYIYRLISPGCIDEKVFQRGVWKSLLSDWILDQSGEKTEQFTAGELKKVFMLNETPCQTHEILQCDCLGELANERSEKKVKYEQRNMEQDLRQSQWSQQWQHFLILNEDETLKEKLSPLDAVLSHIYSNCSFLFHQTAKKE